MSVGLSLYAEDDSQKLLTRAQSGDLEAQLEMSERYHAGTGVPRSPQQVLWWLSRAAEGGHITAQVRLAQRYLNGIGTDVSVHDAQHWFQQAADQGSAEAQFRVAMMRMRAKKSVDETLIALLTKSAEREYAPAAYQLGRLHAEGQGFEQSFEQAYNWYLRAAALQSADACFALGKMYEEGVGLVMSQHFAWHWYTKSADLGDARAQTKLADWYMSGTYVQVSVINAMHWYRRAAYKKNARACFALGALHQQGRFVEAAPDIARYWFQLAAEQKYPPALFALGMMDVDVLRIIAVDRIEAAASAGLPQAQVELGKIYEKGLGRDILAEQAMVWYLRAAEQKNPRAQYHAGRCYQQGVGVEPDIELAIHWYSAAAQQGDPEAQRSLGIIYQHGTAGIQINMPQAEQLLLQAAEQGDVQAQFYVAEILRTHKQDRAARSWMTMASGQGYAPAQFQLGQFWESGIGGDTQAEQAVRWYQTAADQGHAASAQALVRIGAGTNK